MSGPSVRSRELLEEVAIDNGPKVKLMNLSFQDLFIINDLFDAGYLSGSPTGEDQAIVRITLAGRNYLETLRESQRPWWANARDNVLKNAWSIALAVLISWVVSFIGPNS